MGIEMSKLSYDEEQQIQAENRKKYIDKNQLITSIINPPKPDEYTVDVEFFQLEAQLERYKQDYGLELNPDFQRGHVWTQEQQIAFCESFVGDRVGVVTRTVTFNCPDFGGRSKAKHSDLNGVVCVDGLQRLTALMAYKNGEFKIFRHYEGGVSADFFDFSMYSLRNRLVRFQMLFLQTKEEVLKYYLNFNDGGTPHTQEELDRVKGMLQQVQQN